MCGMDSVLSALHTPGLHSILLIIQGSAARQALGRPSLTPLADKAPPPHATSFSLRFSSFYLLWAIFHHLKLSCFFVCLWAKSSSDPVSVGPREPRMVVTFLELFKKEEEINKCSSCNII